MHCFFLKIQEFENPRWQIQDGRLQKSRQLILTSALFTIVAKLLHMAYVINTKLCVKFWPCTLNL